MKKLVFFGDSITDGADVDEALRWTTVSKRELSKLDFDVLVRAVDGETTRNALERIHDDVLIEEPSVVCVQFGINDSQCWKSLRGSARVSEAAFAANLVEIVSKLRLFNVSTVVLHTNHTLNLSEVEASGRTHAESNVIYNETIRKIASQHKCELIDLSEALVAVDPSDYLNVDGVHLSENGHTLYSRIVLERLRLLLEKKDA